MTANRENERMVRDNDLISSLAHRAGDLRSYFRRWIDLEIKALEIDFIALIPQCNGNNRVGLEIKQGRVHQIAFDELSKHLEYLEGAVENLKGGATNDIVEDMWQLEDGINYLRGLVRELRDIRAYLDKIMDGD